MKSIYMRKAWYLDEDILIEGWVDKYGYHPAYGIPCGFSRVKLSKKSMIDKVLFFDLAEAKKTYPNAEVISAEHYKRRKES